MDRILGWNPWIGRAEVEYQTSTPQAAPPPIGEDAGFRHIATGQESSPGGHGGIAPTSGGGADDEDVVSVAGAGSREESPAPRQNSPSRSVAPSPAAGSPEGTPLTARRLYPAQEPAPQVLPC
jgi:hypothetical protein